MVDILRFNTTWHVLDQTADERRIYYFEVEIAEYV
jgi:hypothetical protein